MALNRITFDAGKMGGRACIRGLRIPVATVVRCVASGMSSQEILEAYPDLEQEDIAEAIRDVRFLLDQPISWMVGKALQAAGHEALHVGKLGLGTASDGVILV